MANYYPLIANTTAGQIQELPNGDNLNLLGSNIVNAGTVAGTLTTAAQPNITSVGTLSSLSVTGNISSGNITTSGLVTGNGAGLTSITGANVTGTVALATSATTAGTVTTAAQPNITSVGTLSSLSVTANISGGNLLTGGLISATGAITGAGITGSSLNVSTGNITAGNLNISGGIVDTGALTIVTGSNGNVAITPNGTGILTVSTAASVTGNITGGNLSVGTGTITVGNIVNANANGVGNIGSSTTFFNTVFARATSAQYADLAEMYVADAAYEPGTVVEFGGEHEVTITTTSHSTSVAGIVSTNPSYLMNSTQTGEYVLPVALTGRVPCRVQGPVNKGDVLVSSSTPGVAQRIGVNWQPGCVVGKSMDVIPDNSIQIIEVAVGRL